MKRKVIIAGIELEAVGEDHEISQDQIDKLRAEGMSLETAINTLVADAMRTKGIEIEEAPVLAGRYTYSEAREYMTRHSDSYSRMGMVLSLQERMRGDEWLRLLGDNWTTCDNIADHFDELFGAIESWGCPIEEMMTTEEKKAYDVLPDTITVYRGCGEHNTAGFSWSLDAAVARRFPLLNRYRVAKPILVTATVSKNFIVAVKLDRSEHEVITYNAEIVSIEPIQAD